ncbi:MULTISPECIES: CHAP domain-containing protein [Rahnella]|uniref:CHAP domain-containing protein n=1 Tax=Rahnella laticis TaxID=2787622 RepID=A0ABS0E208_9GAMM|nr:MULTISPECIES: CHAP domain-containing protein [Rahnella]MBF7979118.1 CHAP domain-containing protein [Rahnella laticis]MBF7999617.1 CHAP domain-containing protein [Rahnella sp. LAC-M12]
MWNKHAALTHARQNAHQHSTGLCARYVTNAIRAGGVVITPANALDMGFSLRQSGFIEVPSGAPAEQGDIVVIQPIPGHPYGHAAIYDGQTWYSDFKQKTMYPGNDYRQATPAYQLYRK